MLLQSLVPCAISGSIQMDYVYMAEHEAGVWQWLLGKTVTSIVLQNRFVGIAAPTLARVLPIDLALFGGEMFCQSLDTSDGTWKTTLFPMNSGSSPKFSPDDLMDQLRTQIAQAYAMPKNFSRYIAKAIRGMKRSR